MATEERKAKIWEADPQIAPIWQKVWQTTRAARIGGYGKDWASSDDAYLVAEEFATEVLGEEMAEEFAPEYEDLMNECLAEMAYLLP